MIVATEDTSAAHTNTMGILVRKVGLLVLEIHEGSLTAIVKALHNVSGRHDGGSVGC